MSEVTTEQYLAFSDEELRALNPKGLGKLLFIRHETIYLKNVMRQATADRAQAEALFAELGITWPDYLRLLSRRLRRVLKVNRVIETLDSQQQLALFQSQDTLQIIQQFAIPYLCVFDFDRTITNKAFHPLLQTLLAQQGIGQYWVCSAHGDPEVILAYLQKHRLPIRQSRVRATGSVQAKRQLLWQLALSTDRFLMLSFDDERPLCDDALLLGYHPYLVQKSATPLLKSVGFNWKYVK